MYFDALIMAAVADELREKILGGRVQKVLLPAPLSLGLEIYAHRERHYLLASAHAQAAGLAAYNSQAREATSVAVDYTQRRHVRRIKGARPGLVAYDHEQTIHVTPRGPE